MKSISYHWFGNYSPNVKSMTLMEELQYMQKQSRIRQIEKLHHYIDNFKKKRPSKN